MSIVTAVLMALAGLSIMTAPSASASHYRATQITWHKTGATTAEFHLNASWRCTFYFNPCTASPGDTFTADSLGFGDGTFDTPVFTVVSADPVNDVLTAEAHADHTYATTGPFTAVIDSCCRLSGPQHINNPDGSVRVETIVDLARTTASPESAIAPIVDCPISGLCQFTVPAVDPDGQDLSFRMATQPESGLVQPGPPFATSAASIDATTGRYTWNTTGATLSSSGDTFYSTQVMVLNKVGSTVVSKTPVDFFIRLGSGSSNRQPVFTAPTPADGSNLSATVGTPFSFGIAASDPDASDTVTLGVISAPTGSTLTSTPDNPVTGTFDWTPTTAGSYPLILTATDQNGLGATTRAVTIDVAPASTPQLSVTGEARSEGNQVGNTLRFTLSLSQPASGPVRVSFMTVDRSAQAGPDYTGVWATRVIPAGSTQIKVPVSLVGDRVREPNEAFALKVTQVTGGVGIANRLGIGRILNDDGVTT